MREFWVAAQWRTVSRKTGKVLNESTTRHELKSPRTIDDWFAQPADARAEIETAYARIGEGIAMQFVGGRTPPN